MIGHQPVKYRSPNSRTQTALVLTLGLGLVFSALSMAQPMPLGEEFVVNTDDTGYQIFPAAAMAPSGSFVVVWLSHDSFFTAPFSLTGQRFAADGSFTGNEFPIGNTDQLTPPRVASDDQGNFVVAWRGSSGEGIRARRFAAGGSSIGAEFQVNTYTTGYQDFPDVAMAANGQFVVAWENNVTTYNNGIPSGLDRSLRYRRFDADGTASGADAQILSATGTPQKPRLGIDDGGGFVVLWDDGIAPSGQRFEADGTPAGTSFSVDLDPRAIDVASDGSFVVVSENYVQPYDRFANPAGASSTLSGGSLAGHYPAVDVEPGGEFAVVWQATTSNSMLLDEVHVQAFQRDGTPDGDPVLAGVPAQHGGHPLDIALNGSGHLVAVWESGSFGPPGSGFGDTTIMGRRYQVQISAPTLIFSGNFETGDLGLWSDALP